MPDNILKAIISVTAPGAAKVFNEVGAGAAKLEGKLVALNPAINRVALNVNSLQSAFKSGDLSFKSLGNTAQTVQQRMGTLSGVLAPIPANIAAIAPAANTAAVGFGALLKSFVGAQLITTVLTGVIKLISKSIADMSPVFDSASLAAQNFKDRLEDITEAANKLRKAMDFQDELKDIDFRTRFGDGPAADIVNLSNKLLTNQKAIEGDTKKVEQLGVGLEKLKGIIQTFPQTKLIGGPFSKSIKPTAFGELVNAQREVANLTAEEIKKLPKFQQTIVTAFQAGTKEAKRLGDQIQANKEANQKFGAETGKISADAVREAEKPIKVPKIILKPVKIDIKIPETGLVEVVGITEAFTKALQAGLLGARIPDTFSEALTKDINAQIAKIPIKPFAVGVQVDTKGFEALKQHAREINAVFEGINQVIADSLTQNFSRFIDAVASGENVFKSFGNLVKGIIQQIITDLLKAVATAAILSALSGGVAKGGFSFLQLLGGLLGRRAGGGPVSRGNPYIVGEQGPELFVPNTGGTIVPNSGMGGVGSMGMGGGTNKVVFEIAGTTLQGVLSLSNQQMRRLV